MILWAIYGEFKFINIITNLFIVIFKPIIYIGEAVNLISNNIFKRNQIKSEGTIKEVIKESKVFRQILLGLIISIPLLIIILHLKISFQYFLNKHFSNRFFAVTIHGLNSRF